MIFLEFVGIALSQLWAHKLRSVLTLLGMLIGVGSVVGILSISEGLRRTLIGELGKVFGANLMYVIPRQWIQTEGRWVQAAHYEPLTLDDVREAMAASDRVDVVLPLLQTGVQVQHGKTTYSGDMHGTVPSYTRAYSWEVASGRFLVDRDVAEGATVCVLGEAIRKRVFGEESPLGQEVKLNGERFRVVGVMAERKIFDNDLGYQVMIPVTTAQRRAFGNKQIQGLIAFSRAPEDAPAVAAAIEKALKARHGKESQYEIPNGRSFMEDIENFIMVMKIATGGIAAISLLVGGIGIMNIMLVSVAERTREIGIRKAIGAKPGALRLQFIIEAVTLSLVGGLLGIGTGIGLGLGIAKVINHYSKAPFAFASVVSPESIITSLAIATAIGLFFGIYPAVRASRLNPVDALSSE
jgi:putative ABC transport system permease protein